MLQFDYSPEFEAALIAAYSEKYVPSIHKPNPKFDQETEETEFGGKNARFVVNDQDPTAWFKEKSCDEHKQIVSQMEGRKGQATKSAAALTKYKGETP